MNKLKDVSWQKMNILHLQHTKRKKNRPKNKTEKIDIDIDTKIIIIDIEIMKCNKLTSTKEMRKHRHRMDKSDINSSVPPFKIVWEHRYPVAVLVMRSCVIHQWNQQLCRSIFLIVRAWHMVQSAPSCHFPRWPPAQQFCDYNSKIPNTIGTVSLRVGILIRDY